MIVVGVTVYVIGQIPILAELMTELVASAAVVQIIASKLTVLLPATYLVKVMLSFKTKDGA
jgi:hypothetical protein